jgi:hypothetical protein
VKPAGDHQMNYEPEIAVYSHTDTLADAFQFPHRAALDVRRPGLNRPQYEGAQQPHTFDTLADNSRLERADIGNYVR